MAKQQVITSIYARLPNTLILYVKPKIGEISSGNSLIFFYQMHFKQHRFKAIVTFIDSLLLAMLV